MDGRKILGLEDKLSGEKGKENCKKEERSKKVIIEFTGLYTANIFRLIFSAIHDSQN